MSSFTLSGRLPARDFLGLGRFHIVVIAALAAVVFGWLFDGRLGFVAGGLVAFDWFLLNLFNRIADVPEDRRNGVSGTGFVEQNAGALMRIVFVALALSLIGARPLGTPLLVLRCAFHAGGFAYSFPTVTRRIKEIFLVKNVFSGLLFIVSAIGYPLALREGPIPVAQVVALAAFFLPLEMTYELIYDLRDVEGDAAEGIVTLPIRWGAPRTRAFIELLLALSAAALLAGYLVGALRWRELVMIAAPLQQALVLRFWIPKEVRKQDAIGITWLGAAQLASYVAWIAAGLPLERPW
jgi:4-hydroxybenzoate polyprenyltransferase